ncbi:MAG: ACP S-malonyltransferase [Desulfatitalea sp.]|nr:ACP S-malonyltransferase [Desulfatitalea sp.]MBI5101721.1 ACP S-malonyltransferase [Nitrospirota bacterium]
MATVFMFPGQGSQSLGMGGELFERYPGVVAEADALLGYSIKELCLKDPDGMLNRTDHTQPALYIVDVLDYMAKIEAEGRAPDFVIGHSLGEYAALYAAGAFDFATGLKLVKERGALMNAATGGGMAAILGMDGDAVSAALAELGADRIDVANLNSPRQTVISGPRADIETFAPRLEEKGAKRAVILSVSGAFHSRYMKPAAEEFEAFLAGFSFGSLKITCIANCSARPYTDDSIASNLVKQIYSSVRWTETVKGLRDLGAGTFVEVGPGTVLSGLARQIK